MFLEGLGGGAVDLSRGIGVFIVRICQGVWVGPLHISRGRRLKKGGLGGSLEQVVVRISLVVNVEITMLVMIWKIFVKVALLI